MWLREVVKFLRFAGDVFAEYVAGEQAKHNAARQAAASKRNAEEAARRDAEEAAQRRAAEAAAREAEQRSARERQAKQTTLRRKQRRRGRQGVPVTIPVDTSPELAARMAATPSGAEAPTTPTAAKPAARTDVISSLMAGLPPIVVETINQLQALDGAIRGLLTSTDRMRAWFERVQAHPRWGHVVTAISMTLPMIVQRISSNLYFGNLQEVHDQRMAENYIRMDRMIKGDWREKVRYLHWTNGQRRARALRAAVSAGVLPRDAVPA